MDAAQLNFSVLMPLACVVLGALIVLLVEAFFLGRTAAWLLAAISSLALISAGVFAGSAFVEAFDSAFNALRPMLVLDRLSSGAIGVLSLGALLSVGLALRHQPAIGIQAGEYYALLLLSVAGMFALVMSTDLIALFVGLELMSLPLYALAAFDRRSVRSSEAGLKYFLMGAFASAILLYGLALLYGATGHTGFAGIAASAGLAGPIAAVGFALLVVGLAFKLSAVPFHQWTPDVYEGSPTSVTAFLMVTGKCAAFVVLLRLLSLVPTELGSRLAGVFWGLAAMSLIVGNGMALIQSNIKRLLAFSSIAHVGVMLISLAVGTAEAHAALLFYLFVYVFMNVGVFAVLIALERVGEPCETLEDFAGLAHRRPAQAAAMTLFLLALTGIPGTAGFIAKFSVFAAALEQGFIWLTMLGVFVSLLGAFYYLRMPVMMYMQPSTSDDREQNSKVGRLGALDFGLIAVCGVAVLYFGLLPDRQPFISAIEPLVSVAELSAAQHSDVTHSARDVEFVE